jgi:hypothetical protein
MQRAAWLLIVACGARAPAPTAPPAPPPALPVAAPGALLAPSAFDTIADKGERSRAMFAEVSRVLMHPRCTNCHPADDTPRQGDAHELHEPPAVRGPANAGVPAMQCATCHQDRNLDFARVPGAPNWHLAPPAMAWLGKTASEICAQLSDRGRNGERTLAQVHDHLASDALVAWGWTPGVNRTHAPGSQAELAALFQAWIDTGAVCP